MFRQPQRNSSWHFNPVPRNKDVILTALFQTCFTFPTRGMSLRRCNRGKKYCYRGKKKVAIAFVCILYKSRKIKKNKDSRFSITCCLKPGE